MLNVRGCPKDFSSGTYPNVDADSSPDLFWPPIFMEVQTNIKENSKE